MNTAPNIARLMAAAMSAIDDGPARRPCPLCRLFLEAVCRGNVDAVGDLPCFEPAVTRPGNVCPETGDWMDSPGNCGPEAPPATDDGSSEAMKNLATVCRRSPRSPGNAVAAVAGPRPGLSGIEERPGAPDLSDVARSGYSQAERALAFAMGFCGEPKRIEDAAWMPSQQR
jgi:hypothetical protein